MNFKSIMLCIVLSLTVIIGCGSSKDRPIGNTSLEDFANEFGISLEDFKQFLESVAEPDMEEAKVLACIADLTRDGELDESDIESIKEQYGSSCEAISKAAELSNLGDDQMPGCANLVRYISENESDKQYVDGYDVALLYYLFKDTTSISREFCNDAHAADQDGLSSYLEGRCDIDLDPLSFDTDEDDLCDYYFPWSPDSPPLIGPRVESIVLVSEDKIDEGFIATFSEPMDSFRRIFAFVGASNSEGNLAIIDTWDFDIEQIEDGTGLNWRINVCKEDLDRIAQFELILNYALVEISGAKSASGLALVEDQKHTSSGEFDQSN